MKYVKLGYLILLLLTCVTNAHAEKTYYLITHGSQDPYWQTLFKGAKEAAKDLNINLQIVAPSGANDIPKQLQFLESAIASNPQGIATTIPSNTAFAKSLQKVKKLHIPLVAFDTKPQDSDKNPYLAFMGTDNEKIGNALATQAYTLGAIKERVVILNPQPGHVGLEARAKGIKIMLKEKNIIVDELDVGVDANQIQSRVKSYFLRNPTTSTIFCLTSQALDPLGQMLLYPERNNFKYHPNVFSFDKTPNTVALIQKGIVRSAIDQQPYLMGYFSVTQLVLLNRYGLMPVNINTAA